MSSPASFARARLRAHSGKFTHRRTDSYRGSPDSFLHRGSSSRDTSCSGSDGRGSVRRSLRRSSLGWEPGHRRCAGGRRQAPGCASSARALVGSRARARHGEGGTWRRDCCITGYYSCGARRRERASAWAAELAQRRTSVGLTPGLAARPRLARFERRPCITETERAGARGPLAREGRAGHSRVLGRTHRRPPRTRAGGGWLNLTKDLRGGCATCVRRNQ